MDDLQFKPEVGQLLYYEKKRKDGSIEYTSLIFVDEPVQEGKGWMYTQIAILSYNGNGLEVYTGIEAGGMPPSPVRPATDEDIKMFINYLLKEGPVGKEKLHDWKRAIEEDMYIAPVEKERLKLLISSQ